MKDAVLISQYLEGAPLAIQRVRRWIQTSLTPYADLLGTDSEDLEQEVLLTLTRTLREERFEGRSQLRTFVQRAVHYKCIDRLRAHRRREWIDIDDLELVSRVPTGFDSLSEAQTRKLVLEVYKGMPEHCRELWNLLLQGLRYSEMSRRLGVAEGALRTRLLRCRRQAIALRDRLVATREEIL